MEITVGRQKGGITVFCERCGNQLSKGERFCGQCGWKVPDEFLPEREEHKSVQLQKNTGNDGDPGKILNSYDRQENPNSPYDQAGRNRIQNDVHYEEHPNRGGYYDEKPNKGGSYYDERPNQGNSYSNASGSQRPGSQYPGRGSGGQRPGSQYPGGGSGGQPQKNRGRSIGLLIGLIIAAAAVFFIILVQLGTIKVKNPLSSKNERTAVATETLSGAAGAVSSPADTVETTGQAEAVSTAETAAEAQAEPAQDQTSNAPAAQDGGQTANAPAAQNGGQTANTPAAQNGGQTANAPAAAPAGDQTANAPAAAPAASPLSISVQQVDASAYPEVKLYLDVVNENTGEIPSDLEQMVFYIGREDATATFVEQTVTEVSQLNGSEALKVDMVADISGSMDGYPMEEAKSVMSSFVQSMQFNAGDEVELTSFSNGVHLNEEFTSDASAILNAIDSLYTEDMTALYDALYTSVTRVASQNGARCVIAFTDGDDNYSSCTMDDVIEVAQRYSIPVFIIGVGYVDESAMETIASSTGGVYYGIDEISSMQEIYDQIYRMEKELYLVSYTDSTGLAVEETANLTIRYESSVYVGECSYSYVPNTLINVDAGWLYQDGPEAVVEAYMKNFDDAMTNMDFSYIEPYLEYGSPIYNEQVSYVQRGISEQLDSYEFVDTTYESSTSAIVTTRETYYYQKPGEALKLMTQQCSYRVIYDGSQWQMYEFTDLDVLWRINA